MKLLHAQTGKDLLLWTVLLLLFPGVALVSAKGGQAAASVGRAAPDEQDQPVAVAPAPPGSDAVHLRAPVTASGRLAIVWGDGPPGSGRSAGPVYLLGDEDGRSIELATDLLATAAGGRLLALNGHRVTVHGRWQKVVGQDGDDPVLQVASVEATPLSRSEGSPAADVVGAQPWVSLLCKFADLTAEPEPLSYFVEMYGSTSPGLDHYWRELSYEAITLSGSGAAGWYTLPQPRSYYVRDMDGDGVVDFDRTAAAIDCTAEADPDAYFPDYVGINLMFNGDLDGYAWGGRRTMSLDGVIRTWYMTWEPPWGYASVSVIAHEMGHGFGLPHSSGTYGQVYDNYWDVMSRPGGTCAQIDGVYGCLGQHTISFHKEMLGWILPGERYEAPMNSQATIALERLALPQTGNPKMARIPIGGATDHFYTIEVRKWAGYDVQVPGQAVIIHEVVDGSAYVLDPDGNGDTGDAGAMWMPGEAFVDGTHGITVSVEAESTSGFTVTIGVAPLGAFTSCEEQTEIPVAECAALQALYEGTDGPNWTARSGWLELAWPCSWYGVTCSGGSSRRVTGLALPSNGLAGPLAAELANLGVLETLDLNGNQLVGNIPPGIGALSNLRTLLLYENQLAGEIPTQLGDLSLLEILYLDHNHLAGGIPAELEELSALVALDLGANQLTGSIPPGLGGLTGLVGLYLYSNQLDGAIPPELGDLANLSYLYLHENQLTGNLPPQLGNLGNLQVLALSSNRLEGGIPAEVSGLTSLSHLYLHLNRLSGSLPEELGDLSGLEELWISYNQLGGNIPAALASLTGLTSLDVGYNSLSAADAGLISFLNEKDADWDQTQTVAPANLQVVAVADSSIELAWEPIAYWWDGGYYEIGYATSPGGPYTVHGTTEGTGGKTTTGYVVGSLLPGVSYAFVVRTHTPAHDLQQNALWSETTAEVQGETLPCAVPGAPGLVAPGDGAYTADSTPGFDWQAAAASDGYELQVDGDPGFGNPELVTVTIATAYTPAAPLPDDIYSWRVRGHNTSEGCDVYGDWSQLWTVTVDTVAPVGSIQINDGDAYANDGAVSLGLEASDSVGVAEMNLQTNGAWQGWEVYAPEKEITLAGGDGTHTVTVQYRDAAANSSAAYSDSIELDTTPPGAPTLLSPEDGMSTAESPPTFAWSALAGVAGYQLQVDDDATFDSPEIALTTVGASHTPGSPLPTGTHFWRVRAQDAAGNWSAWSSEWRLEIKAGGAYSFFLPLILNQE